MKRALFLPKKESHLPAVVKIINNIFKVQKLLCKQMNGASIDGFGIKTQSSGWLLMKLELTSFL